MTRSTTPPRSNGGSGAGSPKRRSRPNRILLDQGFPKPPFDIADFDETVEVEHLSAAFPKLAENSTPDWRIYHEAASGGFDAIAIRDRNQLGQLEEMYALSRLPKVSLIACRSAIEDPLREWAVIVAHLPAIKRALTEGRPDIIWLPSPRSTLDTEAGTGRLGQMAKDRGISTAQAREEARAAIAEWVATSGEDEAAFARLLNPSASPRKAAP